MIGVNFHNHGMPNTNTAIEPVTNTTTKPRNDPVARREKKKNTKSDSCNRLKRSRQPTQPSRPTPLVTPPAAEGARKQNRKQQKAERLCSGEKNHPRQLAEEMELAPIRHSTHAPKHHGFDMEWDLRLI